MEDFLHDEVHDDHREEAREHPEDERAFHEGPAELELEAGDDVSRQNDEKGRENAVGNRDDQRVEEPMRIVVHRRIGEEVDEAVERIPRREEAGDRVEVTGRG